MHSLRFLASSPYTPPSGSDCNLLLSQNKAFFTSFIRRHSRWLRNEPNLVSLSSKCNNSATDQIWAAEKLQLPANLRPELMPKHVAAIMDGNRRWAKQKGLPVEAGHRAGARALIELASVCLKFGIKVLTVFAFSTENWIRSKEEVEFLMGVFEEAVFPGLVSIAGSNIRISMIGDMSNLPKSLQAKINETQEITKANTDLHVMVALNYSGRYDITQACKNMAEKVRNGFVQLDDIDEALLEQELETKLAEFPCPDMLIRSSGELRVSNFLLWQLAYTEFVFVEELWPEFDEDKFTQALVSFQARQRRYGGRNFAIKL